MSLESLTKEELLKKIQELSQDLDTQTHINIELRAIAELYDHTQEITRNELITAKETISAQDSLLHLTTNERKEARHTMDAFKNLQNLSQEELLHKNNTLQKILSINNEITGIPKKEILLSYILDSILPVLKAQRGILFLGKDKHFKPKYFTNITKEQIFSKEFRASLKMIRSCVKEKSVLAAPDSKMKLSSEGHLGARAVICAPLKNKEEVLGILYLDSTEKDFSFTVQDAETLEIFTAQAAIAIQNSNLYYDLEKEVLDRTQKLREAYKKIESLYKEIEKDLSLAKRVQEALLSREFLKHPKFNIQVHYEPMSQIGGDIFDIINITEDKIRIFVADATGHGIPAALVTMLIKGIYDRIKLDSTGPAEILQKLGSEFYSYISLNAFFSAIVIDVDYAAKQLVYSNAGHPEQYLIRRNGYELLTSTGKMIGLRKDIVYRFGETAFNEEDSLLLYTDGLTEEIDSKEVMFGDHEMIKFLEESHKIPIEKWIPELLKRLKEFNNNAKLEDDLTILTIGLRK